MDRLLNGNRERSAVMVTLFSNVAPCSMVNEGTA